MAPGGKRLARGEKRVEAPLRYAASPLAASKWQTALLWVAATVAGAACDTHLRSVCEPTTCKTSCCGADGTCHTGDADDACGAAQTACLNCTAP